MRRILISLAALTFLLAPQLTLGADVDDLKAAVEQYVQALNSKDAGKWLSLHHDEWVAFGRDNPFPNVRENNSEFRQTFQQFFDNRDVFTITMIDPQFRVIGNTGIVWGHSRVVVKMKDGPQETHFQRIMHTYVKTGARWLLVARHQSHVPSGN